MLETAPLVHIPLVVYVIRRRVGVLVNVFDFRDQEVTLVSDAVPKTLVCRPWSGPAGPSDAEHFVNRILSTPRPVTLGPT